MQVVASRDSFTASSWRDPLLASLQRSVAVVPVRVEFEWAGAERGVLDCGGVGLGGKEWKGGKLKECVPGGRKIGEAWRGVSRKENSYFISNNSKFN